MGIGYEVVSLLTRRKMMPVICLFLFNSVLKI